MFADTGVRQTIFMLVITSLRTVNGCLVSCWWKRLTARHIKKTLFNVRLMMHTGVEC